MRIVRLVATLSLLSTTVHAQDEASIAAELRELRKAVEQQGKQIEALTEQVNKLAAGGGARAASASSSSGEARPAAANEEFSTEGAPKAGAVPRHVVIKGETLTSIAKHYNVPLSELMKANKGLDERKLQIGQSILLPATPAPKPSESTPNQ